MDEISLQHNDTLRFIPCVELVDSIKIFVYANRKFKYCGRYDYIQIDSKNEYCGVRTFLPIFVCSHRNKIYNNSIQYVELKGGIYNYLNKYDTIKNRKVVITRIGNDINTTYHYMSYPIEPQQFEYDSIEQVRQHLINKYKNTDKYINDTLEKFKGD